MTQIKICIAILAIVTASLTSITPAQSCEPDPSAPAMPCWIDRPDIFYQWLFDVPIMMPSLPEIPLIYSPAIGPPGSQRQIFPTYAEIVPAPISTQTPVELPSQTSPPASEPASATSSPLVETPPQSVTAFHYVVRATVRSNGDHAVALDMLEATIPNTSHNQPNTAHNKLQLFPSGEGWQIVEETNWLMANTSTAMLTKFEMPVAMDVICRCSPTPQQTNFSGTGTMRFRPDQLINGFMEGNLDDISLSDGNGQTLSGDILFAVKEIQSNLFGSRTEDITLALNGKPIEWRSKIIFHRTQINTVEGVEGTISALGSAPSTALVGHFHSRTN